MSGDVRKGDEIIAEGGCVTPHCTVAVGSRAAEENKNIQGG